MALVSCSKKEEGTKVEKVQVNADLNALASSIDGAVKNTMTINTFNYQVANVARIKELFVNALNTTNTTKTTTNITSNMIEKIVAVADSDGNTATITITPATGYEFIAPITQTYTIGGSVITGNIVLTGITFADFDVINSFSSSLNSDSLKTNFITTVSSSADTGTGGSTTTSGVELSIPQVDSQGNRLTINIKGGSNSYFNVKLPTTNPSSIFNIEDMNMNNATISWELASDESGKYALNTTDGFAVYNTNSTGAINADLIGTVNLVATLKNAESQILAKAKVTINYAQKIISYDTPTIATEATNSTVFKSGSSSADTGTSATITTNENGTFGIGVSITSGNEANVSINFDTLKSFFTLPDGVTSITWNKASESGTAGSKFSTLTGEQTATTITNGMTLNLVGTMVSSTNIFTDTIVLTITFNIN